MCVCALSHQQNGDESANKLIKTGGPEIDKSNKHSHTEIAAKFDLVDFINASKLTGNKFVFLKNEAAQLELALSNWAFNFVAK